MSLRAGDKSTADVVIIGAGLIGLTLALEMHHRGARVCIVERGRPMAQASTAAAGMLAADDPSNPPQLFPLSRLSVVLYPGFLRRLEVLSGIAVPFQTQSTLQYAAGSAVTRLAENSLDPRDLASALLAAVRATPIQLLQDTSIQSITHPGQSSKILTTTGLEIATRSLVYTAGAWTKDLAANEFGTSIPILPRKGQMLRVRLPAGLELRQVHRSEQVYIVPRTAGPQAGTALIGATIEDAGFDITIHHADLANLRRLASALLPDLESEANAPLIEAWAGLRPATPDMLPVLGASPDSRSFIATGHYRNGILLAPATAAVMADLLTAITPPVDLAAFSPNRFLP